MRKLSLILGILLSTTQLKAQDNPHGEKFQINCLDCHSTESWNFLAANAKFSHDSTSYKLEGQHIYTDCRACHTLLVFMEAKTNCMDCHTDLHNNTVGLDCARCHTPKSWLVQNITEIHQSSRFPLLGAHNTADCSACHVSASNLEFNPLGVECIDCHRADYQTATNPNHVLSQISTDCFDCHRIEAFEWRSRGFNHQFFPLTKGHEINNCAMCHTSGVFEPISTDCITCHQSDFVSATNPSHNNQGFSTQCTVCHTTEPGWKPAKFDIHDNFYFPVFSGKHRGEWNSCSDCHTSTSNYSVFSCVTCHEHNRSEMDNEHRGVGGYIYESISCLECHPKGTEDD